MTAAQSLPITFSPVFSWPLLGLVLFLILGASSYYYLKLRPILSAGRWRWLFATKLLGLAVLALALMRPSFHSSTPDDRDFTAVFLLDASRSMGTSDCNGKRRVDVVKDDITRTSSPFYKAVIEPYENRRVALFSDGKPRPITEGATFTLLPGSTDIDGAIRSIISGNTSRKQRIGTILLATDGNDNVGNDLMSVSEELRVQGIPLNCIGIGNPRPGIDVGIAFEPVKGKVVKGRPFELTTRLSGRLDRSRELELRLFDNDRLLETRTLNKPKGRVSGTETFALTALLTGLRTYKVEVVPVAGEGNLQNNRDYTGVEVRPPDLFKCLYVSHTLTWDFKYLKRLAGAEKKLELSAVIRLGEDNWMTYGLVDTKLKGVPEPALLNTFDCIILDLQSMETASQKTWDAISGFAEQRGGGVIFLGLPGAFSEPLTKLLPVKRDTVAYKRLGQTPIDISSTSLLFNRNRNDYTDLKGIYLPEETPFMDVRKKDMKRAARAGATVGDSDLVVVAGHNVGAGKTALVTIPDSWKWAMNSPLGQDQYAVFWSRLISWSATGPKERLTISPGSSIASMDESLKLYVNLLRKDFTPDNGATVSATLTTPDGAVRTIAFFDNPGVDGQYLQTLIPTDPGVYTLRTKIETTGQETMEATTEYMFVDRSAETGIRPMAEGVLQNLAQSTGGRYWRYDEIGSIKDLPLSTSIQMRHSEYPLSSSWWFVLAILLFILPDWILRRRTGLR